jgi:hypothetical protein
MGNSAICTPSINKNKRSEFLTTRKLYEALIARLHVSYKYADRSSSIY